MNFNELFVLQSQLDNCIRDEHNLNGSLLSKKLLSLQVKIGELANETRCFKYWSNKKPSDKKYILEEYVDCLHFILSIGLEKKYTEINLNQGQCQTNLTEQFLNLFIDINDFTVCSSKDHYITLFEDFLILGFSVTFTIEDIKKAYIDSISSKMKVTK